MPGKMAVTSQAIPEVDDISERKKDEREAAADKNPDRCQFGYSERRLD